MTSQAFKNGVGVEDIVLTSTVPNLGVTSPPVVIGGEMIFPSVGSTTTTGQYWSESNFWLAPEAPSTAQSTAGGALTLLGTYGFIVVYEWMDANGQWTRSAPSPSVSVTLTGTNNTVTLTIPTLRLTQKANVIISVYQTAAAGTAYYKITDDLAPTYNSTSADTVSFSTGTITDAQLPARQELYTDGTPVPLSNGPAPPHTVSAQFGGRVYLYGYDGGLWISKTHIEGSPTSFNGNLRMPIDATIVGAVTAMAVMDNRLVLFSKKGAFTLVGDPPDDNGLGTFPVLVALPETVGCDGVAVTTKEGVMYSAPDNGGIWLLRRDLTSVYVGAPVEDTTLTSSIIAAGTSQNLVYFQAYEAGTMLVYDTALGGWYVWPMVAGNAYGGCIWDGQGQPQWTWVNSNFSVTTQSAGYYGDETLAPGDAQAIPLIVGFNSLNFAGVGGFQRIWNLQILGAYVDTHSLSVTLDYDQIPSVVETFAFTPNGTAPYRYEFPKVQKCTSLDMLITEVPVGLTAGYTLESLGALVGVKEGMDKLPSAQRIQGV
jgi:hypothetical protein